MKRNNKARIIMFPANFGSAEHSGYIEVHQDIPAGAKLSFELYKETTLTGRPVHKGPAFTLDTTEEHDNGDS